VVGAAAGARSPARRSRRLLKKRFAIIQVWRAINQPIRANPLAPGRCAQRRRPTICSSPSGATRTASGQTYRLKYNPAHRWFYFPELARNEAIVFKVYDSATDGRARFTPHTSFADPATPPGAPPRQSIEARLLVFF
jgi:hypothetical protein